MYRLDREDFLKYPLFFLWPLLGFQAGFLNAFGFLACGRYVSHVTGFGTQIGITLAQNQWLTALELLGFPLSFIFGAFTSGFFTCARRERGLKPRYDWITLLLPIMIAGITILGHYNFFGDFGEPLINTRDFILLFALSFACGMQNGCFATLTKGQIRTTHLTGISTDIGTDFARLFFGKLTDIEFRLVKRTNLLRIATFFAFSLGSVFSVMATKQYNFLALFIPLMSSMIVYSSMKLTSQKMDKVFNTQNDAINESVKVMA